ncbi:MAG: hypothetical protein A2Y10_13125 [Planctomycetes bacterium GWF2_41_51]|nr:MAG: hypothetical protein A2Y10_13125 [Planctomycetes bacterium GWF2_41_51]HBG60701.1 hypothetical protein [Candidatus Omnitrophota bacterium]
MSSFEKKMGTTSTTRIYEDGQLLLALYKQYDGYPDGWGQQLKEFFHKGTFVNGFSRIEGKLQFNGVGDFALLLVNEFKEGTGGLYATDEGSRQEYNYIIKFDHNRENWNKVNYSISCLEDDGFLEAGQINLEGW